MTTFNFPYHQLIDVYPDSSASVKFGRGYTFASAPVGPDQLTFKLKFEAMFWWITNAGALSNSIQPDLNLTRLVEFYETHRMYETFTYIHPFRGSRTVRFEKPLPEFTPMKDKVMRISAGRGHQVEPFEIRLIEAIL